MDLHTFLENWQGEIQALLFDLDGTLRHSQPSPTKTFFDYAVSMGVNDSPEKRHRIARWTHYYWAESQELSQDVQKFGGLGDDFWENYSVRSLLAFDCSRKCAQELAPRVNRIMQDEFHSEDYVYPDVPPTLEALQASGLRLGVLSNRHEPCDADLEQLGLSSYFDLAMVAGEVDAWKPDPVIFQHALQRLDLSAQEVFYVGDNYYADVIGAQRAHVQPILIDPDDVFPDAECPVIRSIGEMRAFIR